MQELRAIVDAGRDTLPARRSPDPTDAGATAQANSPPDPCLLCDAGPMASRENRLRSSGNHCSTLLEPVGVDGRVYLTNDARHVGDLEPLVPDGDLGQLLELVDLLSSRSTEELPHAPHARRRAQTTQHVADLGDWL